MTVETCAYTHITKSIVLLHPYTKPPTQPHPKNSDLHELHKWALRVRGSSCSTDYNNAKLRALRCNGTHATPPASSIQLEQQKLFSSSSGTWAED